MIAKIKYLLCFCGVLLLKKHKIIYKEKYFTNFGSLIVMFQTTNLIFERYISDG